MPGWWQTRIIDEWPVRFRCTCACHDAPPRPAGGAFNPERDEGAPKRPLYQVSSQSGLRLRSGPSADSHIRNQAFAYARGLLRTVSQ